MDSIEIFLCDTIARMAWGEVSFPESEDNVIEVNQLEEEKRVEKYKSATWILKSNELSQNSPRENLINYREYLNSCTVFTRADNDEDLDEQTNTIMKDRNFKLLEFISNEGKIFKENYDKLLEAMKLPANAIVKESISESLKECYDNRRYNIIPAFFKTIQTLSNQNRGFSVVFRTHGRELHKVIEEFNLFCEGDHPAFNGKNNDQVIFNGKKCRDLRIKDQQKGMYFRFGKELSDVHLLMNTLERIQWKTTDDLLENYGGQIEEGTISHYCESIEENYEIIMETIGKYGSMAIQDDFYAYYNHKDDSSYGKLLLIDQADFNTQHIFFDDMAIEGKQNNIDVRDLSTSEKIVEKKFRNKYVVKADIYEAILDDQYFLKKIKECERARDWEIERLQDGILSSEDEVEEQQENKWETLQNLPNEEYLLKTVAPLLYQGLNHIATERPTNPIEFLVLYLLQKKDLVKIPTPEKETE